MLCGLLGLFAGNEFAMLRAANRAILEDRQIANSLWISSIFLETSLPALAIAFVSSESIDPAYRPLTNPAALTYFLFIILFTLHLNP